MSSSERRIDFFELLDLRFRETDETCISGGELGDLLPIHDCPLSRDFVGLLPGLQWLRSRERLTRRVGNSVRLTGVRVRSARGASRSGPQDRGQCAAPLGCPAQNSYENGVAWRSSLGQRAHRRSGLEWFECESWTTMRRSSDARDPATTPSAVCGPARKNTKNQKKKTPAGPSTRLDPAV